MNHVSQRRPSLVFLGERRKTDAASLENDGVYVDHVALSEER
jgi:hypothetical protein